MRCANTFNNADSLHGGCGPLTTFYVYSKIILFKESLNAKCLWMEGIDGGCGSACNTIVWGQLGDLPQKLSAGGSAGSHIANILVSQFFFSYPNSASQ